MPLQIVLLTEEGGGTPPPYFFLLIVRPGSDHRTPPSAVAKPSRMMRAKSHSCIAVLGGTVPTQAMPKGHSAKKRTTKNQRGGYQDREPLILPTR